MRHHETVVRAALPLVVVALALIRASVAFGEAPPARTIPLPEPSLTGEVAVEECLASRRSVRRYSPEPPSLAEVSQLLWAAQGVTDDRGHRTAPSAGALYPLEILLVARRVEGLSPGLYRYRATSHRLLRIGDADAGETLDRTAGSQSWVRRAPAVIAIVGVVARSTPRYGSRAQRYVHMEAGAVAENVYLQATGLGLGTVLVGAFRDQEVAEALGLSPGERPLALMPIGRR